MSGPAKQKLDAMICSAMNIRSSNYQFSVADAQWLCKTVKSILEAEPTLLEFSGPVNICGDVHGQYTDLVRALQMGGLPPFAKWLFLGDYVDRGPCGVEVMCLLFALKIRYPSQIYLLRGNHETPEMTESFDFAAECLKKLNGMMWQTFCDIFEYLPLAAVISGQYFCVHGGISPDLVSLQQIRDIERPVVVQMTGLVTDLLWSDPSKNVAEYAPSARGSTVVWGMAPAKRFLQNTRLKYIVRGHQVAMQGYEYPFLPNKSVITMFTASNYAPDCHNRAAFLSIDQSGHCEVKVLPPMLPMPQSGAVIPKVPIPMTGRPKTLPQQNKPAAKPPTPSTRPRSNSQAGQKQKNAGSVAAPKNAPVRKTSTAGTSRPRSNSFGSPSKSNCMGCFVSLCPDEDMLLKQGHFDALTVPDDTPAPLLGRDGDEGGVLLFAPAPSDDDIVSSTTENEYEEQ